MAVRFWRTIARVCGAREPKPARCMICGRRGSHYLSCPNLVGGDVPEPGGLPGAEPLSIVHDPAQNLRVGRLTRLAGSAFDRPRITYGSGLPQARWIHELWMPPLPVESRTVVNPEPVQEEWTGPPNPDTVFSYLPAWRRRG